MDVNLRHTLPADREGDLLLLILHPGGVQRPGQHHILSRDGDQRVQSLVGGAVDHDHGLLLDLAAAGEDQEGDGGEGNEPASHDLFPLSGDTKACGRGLRTAMIPFCSRLRRTWKRTSSACSGFAI